MSKSYRELTVGGEVYLWKVGDSHVDIRSSDGSRMSPSLVEMTGLTWDDIERGKWKRWFKITPGHVRKYIEGKTK